MSLTAQKKRKAELQALEVEREVRNASSILTRVGADFRRAFKKNKTLSSQQFYLQALDAMTEALIVSHLRAARRATKLSLIDKLNETLNLDIAALQRRYRTRALKILNDESSRVDRELRIAINSFISEGVPVRKAAKLLDQKFVSLGIIPTNSYQAENIMRTQSQLVYNSAKYEAEQEFADEIWGYTYVTVGDHRVRPEHAALDGTTLPKDDELWDLIWPPNGWSCRCQLITLFVKERVVRPRSTVEVHPDFQFNPGKVLAV